MVRAGLGGSEALGLTPPRDGDSRALPSVSGGTRCGHWELCTGDVRELLPNGKNQKMFQGKAEALAVGEAGGWQWWLGTPGDLLWSPHHPQGTAALGSQGDPSFPGRVFPPGASHSCSCCCTAPGGLFSLQTLLSFSVCNPADIYKHFSVFGVKQFHYK